MKEYIQNVIEVLRKGGIILYPTDTVWGLGCDSTNSEAIKRIYELKKSDNKQGMIVLADSVDMVSRYTNKVPSVAWDLIELEEKPLTLIYPQSYGLAQELIADDGSIAIRVVKHEFCNNLIRGFRKPIVSTSANISGRPSPQSFSEIPNILIDNVDFVVDQKYLGKPTGKPSSIIKLGTNSEVKVIRP